MIVDSASWIAMPDNLRGQFAPLIRREFAVEQAVVSATLSLCGLGCHDAYINGHKVGDHVLDPTQTDYDQRCFYVTHDVMALLQKGANAIGVILGNGWFNQDVVWDRRMSYGPPRLIATLTIQYADGSTSQISTDESWHCSYGPITFNNLYAGEHYDARMERQGWSQPGYREDTGRYYERWMPCEIAASPGGKLEEQIIPPMKIVETLRPISIHQPQPCYHVVDFGQNFSGWIHIHLRAKAGTVIRMRFAEALGADGMIDTASTGVFATRVEQIDTYICHGQGEESWRPRFTYHGFRYVEIVGWPGEMVPDAVVGEVIHTALKTAGHFECSDSRLNTLHRMALWTHRSNLHGLPEDCPARERCGWLGDAHIICDYSFYNFDGDLFWRKYLDDIETSRRRFDGLPRFVAPGKRDGGTASPDWMAALILVPWRHYVYYGHSDVLARHWAGMRTVIEHFQSLSQSWLLPQGLGDWFDPGVSAQPRFTPPVKTSTMIFGDCARIMAKAARVLGHAQDAECYQEWADHIRESFIREFYDSSAHSFGSQTADAMALQLGFVPDGHASQVAASLVRDIQSRDTHVTTGIMGLKYIFDALSQHGYGDVALALFHQNTYPSFGELINRGATTLWEYWGEKEVDQRHCARSLNHPMMAAFDAWFYGMLAGIRPDFEYPGFKRFFLEPHPVHGVTWIKAGLDIRTGCIRSDWQYDSGRFSWRISVPEGSVALAKLPGHSDTFELGPGEHQF